MYYIITFELLTEGEKYVEKVCDIVNSQSNEIKDKWYATLKEGLASIRGQFSEKEFECLDYKRHNASCIFQNQYEIVQEDGSVKEKKMVTNNKGDKESKELIDLQQRFWDVLHKHGGMKVLTYS